MWNLRKKKHEYKGRRRERGEGRRVGKEERGKQYQRLLETEKKLRVDGGWWVGDRLDG